MALIRAAVIQHYYTNLPADVAVNDLWFETENPADNVTDQNAILTALNNAYGHLEPFRAGVLKTTGSHTIKLYDNSAPPNSPPIRIGGPYNMSAPTNTTNLPLEVAVCASFRGTYDVPVNPQSVRGRAYLGPFNNTAIAYGDADTWPSVATGLITAVGNWMDDIVAVGGTARWVVYSRKLEVPWLVVAGWIDNDFDTQRRRGVDATARTAWAP